MELLVRKTRRLVIRPLRATDYRAWRTANSTMLPKQNPWDKENLPARRLTRIEFRKNLAAQRKHRRTELFVEVAIFTRAGELVGSISYMDLSRGVFQNAYLGYSVMNRHWGKGYAKESVRASFDIGFRDLRLHRIEAGIQPGNRRSIALAQSLGMRREGMKKRSLFLRNQWIDLWVYALTCEDVGVKFRGTRPTLGRR